MRIVADDAIPWLAEAFSGLGDLVAIPGRQIDAAAVRDAEVLLTRSVTRVDAALVDGAALRFVGSATAGVDHVDRVALAERGIAFANAPGCNAQGVVEYVVTSLLGVAAQRGADWLLEGPVGIVGFGQIGRRLAPLLRALGLEVLVNDPPLQASAAAQRRFEEPLQSLAKLTHACRVVTLHVPMVEDGPWPTRHLVNATVLDALRPDALLVNTSRGGVIDDFALSDWLEAGRGAAVLDVWEGEPDLRPPLLRSADAGGVLRATPHIAGYTLEGKARGTAMIHAALARFLGRSPTFDTEHVTHSPASDPLPTDCVATGNDLVWIADILRRVHDLTATDEGLRTLADLPANSRGPAFEKLRREYRLRRELSHYALPDPPPFAVRRLPAPIHVALERLQRPDATLPSWPLPSS